MHIYCSVSVWRRNVSANAARVRARKMRMNEIRPTTGRKFCLCLCTSNKHTMFFFSLRSSVLRLFVRLLLTFSILNSRKANTLPNGSAFLGYAIPIRRPSISMICSVCTRVRTEKWKRSEQHLRRTHTHPPPADRCVGYAAPTRDD